MKMIGRIFVRGLALLLPLVVTGFVLIGLLRVTDAFFGSWIRPWLPEGAYHPGTGLLTGIVLIFLMGIIASAPVVKSCWKLVDGWLLRVPVVRTVYGAVSDFMRFVTGGQHKRFSQVVMVSVGKDGRMIGLVTREDFSDLPAGVGAKEDVAVYLPMGYQMGGFTVIVPRSAIEPVKFSVEEAMRFAFTAGLSGNTAAEADHKPHAKNAKHLS